MPLPVAVLVSLYVCSWTACSWRSLRSEALSEGPLVSAMHLTLLGTGMLSGCHCAEHQLSPFCTVLYCTVRVSAEGIPVGDGEARGPSDGAPVIL